MKLPKLVTKRNGNAVPFEPNKIVHVINKARIQTGEFEEDEVARIADKVLEIIVEKNHYEDLTVEKIQDYVEIALMAMNKPITAKAFILYRAERIQARKPDLFKYRLNLKPYEYPSLAEYKEAIQHSYWLHTEFNYTSDIHDFKVNVNDAERSAIKNAMVAIAQVEVAVKNFWGDLHNRFPKPEIGSVGFTFAESEVRHADAYSHLLEILGLNDEFAKIKQIPQLMQRVDYLTKASVLAKTNDNRDFTEALILFSLFIEHVSLFSQFLIIMAFNKHKNLFKGTSNAIEATSKEEQIHGLFGIELVNILRQEHPEWFDQEMEDKIKAACRQALASEEIVIDWIYEAGDLDFIPKQVTKEFVKNRLNNSLKNIGYEPIFEIDEKMVESTDWFDDEVVATKHVDFFSKRSINYTKRTRSITDEDLF